MCGINELLGFTPGTCEICGNECECRIHGEFYEFRCPFCGNFSAPNPGKHPYNLSLRRQNHQGTKEEFDIETAKIIYLVHKKTFGRNDYPLITGDDLNIVKYPLSLSEQIDEYVLWAGKLLKYPGNDIKTQIHEAFFGCANADNFWYLLDVLEQERIITKKLLEVDDFEKLSLARDGALNCYPSLSKKGWDKFDELNRKKIESKQAFVAMWYNDKEDLKQAKPNMMDVYTQALEPAIKNNGYEACVLNQIEHVNDINDEMISQIRKSKFLVADLTGYRGGVYWEAGFAYGLGLPVIYTCHRSWLKPEYNDNNEIIREGVHFDVEHRNMILWDNAKELKVKLANRIAAVII